MISFLYNILILENNFFDMPEQLMSTISQFKARKIHIISHLAEVACSSLLLQLLHTLNKKTALPIHQYSPRTLPRHRQQRASLLLRSPASCPSVYSEQIAVQMADGNRATYSRRAEQRNARAEEERKQQRQKKACVDR